MALMRGKPQDIPADAVRMSEDEALMHQWKLISDNDNLSIL